MILCFLIAYNSINSIKHHLSRTHKLIHFIYCCINSRHGLTFHTHPVFKITRIFMTTYNFNKTSTHDITGLNRKISIFGYLCLMINPQYQNSLSIIYFHTFYHTHIHAGIVNSIPRFNSFRIIKISRHMISAFTE